jgi:outer membrane usher protein
MKNQGIKQFILIAIIGICLFQSMSVKAQTRLIVPVFLETEILGEYWFYPKASSENSYFTDPLLLKKMKSKIKGLKRLKLEGKKITFKNLSRKGVKASFDQAQLSVTFKVPVQTLALKKIDLGGGQNFSHTRVADGVSGKINFRYTENFNKIDGQQLSHNGVGNIESAWNMHSIVAYGDFQYEKQREAPVYQNNLFLSRDWAKENIRIQAGDISLFSQGFQRQIQGGGIQLGRIRELRAFTFFRGDSRYELLIERPSLVEVFVNGQLMRRFNSPAGPLSLEDFPFARGQNSVKLRVTENTGNIRLIDLQRLYEPNLFRRGTFDFDAALFFPSELDSSSSFKSYDTSIPSLQAYTLWAPKQSLNIGGNLQSNANGWLLGGRLAFVSALGIVSLDQAASGGQDQFGAATGFNFQTLDRYGGRFVSLFYQADITIMGNQFKDPFEVNSRNLRSRLGQQILWRGQEFFNASLGGVWSQRRFGGRDRIFRLNLGQNWRPELRTNIEFQDLPDSNEKRIILGLSWFEREGKGQVYSRYQDTPESLTTQFSLRPVARRQNYEFTGTHILTSDSESLEMGGQANTQRVQTRANLQRSVLDGRENETRGNIFVGSALAFAGGKWAISRPIGDSFVIVDDLASVKGREIAVNPENSGYEASIDGLGPAVLSDSQSYSKEFIDIDNRTLKQGESLKKSRFEIELSHLEGRLVQIQVLSQKAVLMRLLNAKRRPLSLEAGEYFQLNGDKLGDFFTNSTGVIYLENVPKTGILLKFFNRAIKPIRLKFKRLSPGLNRRGDYEVR